MCKKGFDHIRCLKYKLITTSILTFLILAPTAMIGEDIKTEKEQTSYCKYYSQLKTLPISVKDMKIPKVYEIDSNKNTSFKAFMDYKHITDKTSKQWELKQLAKLDENGLYKINDYYCVAIGTKFTSECGNKFLITLDTGIEFKIIVADVKNPKHTNKTNEYTPLMLNGKNVYDDNGIQMVNYVEFIVKEKKLSHKIRKLGDISPLNLDGNIVRIEEIIE